MSQDKILSLVRLKGPLLPSQINKELNTNVLFASAMLSELVDRKQLKLSHAKIGGSPVYFMEGQEHRLEMLYGYLHEKLKKAYDLLKNDKVLNDAEQEPVVRAALRELKDFARPLDVFLDGEKHLFWKWHVFPDKEAETIIKTLLGMKDEAAQVEKVPIEEAKPPEEAVLERPVVEVEEPPVIENDDEVEEPVESEVVRPKKESASKQVHSIIDDDLWESVERFCSDNEISIIEHDVIRKGSEIDLLIDLPSSVGPLRYYCKAKSKKKLNEGDISAVYIQGQKAFSCVGL